MKHNFVGCFLTSNKNEGHRRKQVEEEFMEHNREELIHHVLCNNK